MSKLIYIIIFAQLVAALPASADDQPNLCFEPAWREGFPGDAQGFADLKRMCEHPDKHIREAAWKGGWERHPDNGVQPAERPYEASNSDPPKIREVPEPVERRPPERESQPQRQGVVVPVPNSGPGSSRDNPAPYDPEDQQLNKYVSRGQHGVFSPVAPSCRTV